MILAIDTALGAASACLLAPGAPAPFARESLAMQTGHGEALLPLIDRVVARCEKGFAAVTRVAVTIGPGSFTGIRIGVAAARAIGLACRVPVVGVSTLAVLAAPAMAEGGRPIVAAVDARHGNIYVQGFDLHGRTVLGPALMSIAEAARAVGSGPFRAVGSGGPMLAIEASSIGTTIEVDGGSSMPDIAFAARLGALADPAQALPRPFYLKPPDAHPPPASSLAAIA